jgi:hypothetical protein
MYELSVQASDKKITTWRPFICSWVTLCQVLSLPKALEDFLDVGVQCMALRSSARVKKRWYCREFGLTFMRLLPVIMY